MDEPPKRKRYIVILPNGRGDVIDAWSPAAVLRIIRKMLATGKVAGTVPRRTQIFEVKARAATD